MRILLIGATGFSGNEVLQELLRQNHKVTAITRSAQSFTHSHSNLRVLEGSVLDPAFIQSAVQSQDAVINCLGVGAKGNGKTTTLLSDAAKVLVDAMKQSNVKRLINMSNVGAGDSYTYFPWVFRALILPNFMKWLQVIIDDKNRMEPIIMNSPLDWTIARFPNIVDKPAKNKVTATLDGKGLKLSITNSDVAQFMVGQLTDPQFIRKAPSISN